MPEELAGLLALHKVEQERERRLAGEEWHETGYVFTSPTGEPLVPSTEYDAWKQLLTDAKVRDRRLHDARHTAVTVLLILGVPERVVMQIMSRSSTAMAARYQHVTSGIRRSEARRRAHPAGGQGSRREGSGALPRGPLRLAMRL